MKACAACCEELPKSTFSKKQWGLSSGQNRRCADCITANRAVAKNDGNQRGSTSPNQSRPPTKGDAVPPNQNRYTKEHMKEVHKNLKTTKEIPSWMRERTRPNDGNQFLRKGGANQRRKPCPPKFAARNGIADRYWQGGGMYQSLFDELVDKLPLEGPASTKAGELIRSANKLMYDFHNNGMMNNTSSALCYLAREGIFPTAGGDKVYATIYPYSLGPWGNTPYNGNCRDDDLQRAIECMIDRTCKFIIDNPHLKEEENVDDDMMLGPTQLEITCRGRDLDEVMTTMKRQFLTEAEHSNTPNFERNAMRNLQMRLEMVDKGGCTHGRPPLHLLGKSGFSLACFLEDTMGEAPTARELKRFLDFVVHLMIVRNWRLLSSI